MYQILLFKEAMIPQELIERLSNSEIRTMSDLQRLLELHSAGTPTLCFLSAANFVPNQ